MRNQIVPWFGSKALLGPVIAKHFGPHRAYYEPFGGGLGMLLAKPPCRAETVNDLHDDLTNLARVLAHRAESIKLQKMIDHRMCCETLHVEARKRLRLPFVAGVDRAADFFYVSWMGMTGTAGAVTTDSMAHGWTADGGTAASKLRGAAASIEAFHARLAMVTITNRDAFAMLARIQDRDGILIYCDPPYVTKGARYRHDLQDADHARLAAELSRFRSARVVVSYTDHPLLDRLYKSWIKVRMNYRSPAANRTGKKLAKPDEILLMNRSAA